MMLKRRAVEVVAIRTIDDQTFIVSVSIFVEYEVQMCSLVQAQVEELHDNRSREYMISELCFWKKPRTGRWALRRTLPMKIDELGDVQYIDIFKKPEEHHDHERYWYRRRKVGKL